MKRTVAENFDLLLDIAGRGGRGPKLYGERPRLLHRAFEEALLSNTNPAVYVEFPLSGKPYADMQLVYDRVQRGAECRGAGYAAYQPMFDWFAGICGADGLSCGLAIDVSKAEDSIGVYLQQRDRLDFLAPFLESVGEKERSFWRLGGWLTAAGGSLAARPSGKPCLFGMRTAGRLLPKM